VSSALGLSEAVSGLQLDLSRVSRLFGMASRSTSEDLVGDTGTLEHGSARASETGLANLRCSMPGSEPPSSLVTVSAAISKTGRGSLVVWLLVEWVVVGLEEPCGPYDPCMGRSVRVNTVFQILYCREAVGAKTYPVKGKSGASGPFPPAGCWWVWTTGLMAACVRH